MENKQEHQPLVVSNNSKALALTQVRDWMTTLPADRPKLGVSRQYLVKLVEKHQLTREDLDVLMQARTCGGSFARMNTLLAKGFTPIEVSAIYETRQHILVGLPEEIRSISLSSIVKFVRTFPSSGMGEEEGLDGAEVADMIVDAITSVRASVRWIKYTDSAIDFLCDTAEYFNVTDVEAALDAIEAGYRRKERD